MMAHLQSAYQVIKTGFRLMQIYIKPYLLLTTDVKVDFILRTELQMMASPKTDERIHMLFKFRQYFELPHIEKKL